MLRLDLDAATRFGAVFWTQRQRRDSTAHLVYFTGYSHRFGETLFDIYRSIASRAAQGRVGAENTLDQTLISALDTGFRVIVSELPCVCRATPFQNRVSDLLSHHNRGDVRVGPRAERHHRGVGDSHTGNAADAT